MTAIRFTRSEHVTTGVLLAAGLAVAAIGGLALLGWVLDAPGLTTWKADTQPMAHSTAALSILFGAALCLGGRLSQGRAAPLLACLFGWVGVMAALLLFTLRLLGEYRTAEHLGLRITGSFGDVPGGFMPLSTAFLMLLAFASLLASLPVGGRQSWRVWLAWGCAGLLTLGGLVLLLAYTFGNPMLSGNLTRPPALNTCLILLIMGLALLLLATHTGRVASPVAADTVKPRPYVLVLAVSAAVALAVAYHSYRDTEKKFRQLSEIQLHAVSELKTDELVRWRNELLGDAALSQDPWISAAVRRLLETPHSLPVQQELQDWLGKYERHFGYFGYDQAYLLDANGATLMSVPSIAKPTDAILAKNAVAALRLGQVTLHDFYRDENDQRVHLALLVPILDNQDANRPLGVIVLRIDPATFLYPFLSHWPMPSATGETLLVRRDGNDVLILNNLRFKADAALNLRLPLAEHSQQVAAQAVRGHQGIIDSVDYRGEPVLAAVSAIPDTPWRLVIRMDKAELYAPLRERMWLTVLGVAVFVCVTGTVLSLLWRKQKLSFRHHQLELATSLRDSEEQQQIFLDTALDGFLLADMEGRLLKVNITYCRMSGYSEQELLAMGVADLDDPETAEATAARLQRIIAQGGERFECRHRRKDGSIFDVEASIHYQPGPDGQFMIVLHDITVRKQAKQKLRLAASVFSHAREGIMITDADGTIIDANDAFTDITGYSRSEILGENPRLFNSGHHETEFYAVMWGELLKQGYWHGETWNRHKDGELFAVMHTISAVHNSEGDALQYIALWSDITLIKERELELEHIAHYDVLTRLPNRVLLGDRLRQAIAQTRRRGQGLAVAYLDLDGFKAINDSYGHDTGDQLLVAVATGIKKALREGDTLARVGGDEFIAVLVDSGDIDASVPILNRLLSAAAKPVHIGDIVLQVSASLGVTFYSQADDIDADQLLRQADQAMYQAKLDGKNRYHFFDAAQDSRVRTHNESLAHIRQALAAHEFVLYYQPKVNLRTGSVIGAEALIRWQLSDNGPLLPPSAFLPVIEGHPLAVDLGDWVIGAALTQMGIWQAAGLNIPVSVNVDASHLQQTDFVERLRTQIVAHPDFRPGNLQLEVLETSAMEDLDLATRLMGACQQIGVSFALDDFGTGYSSLTYLKRLPVNMLKIDQSFVRDMLDDPDDLAIVEGVVGLATAFRLKVIAEGVETIEHAALLLQLGCDLAQGYGIARPMPADQLPTWMATWKPEPAWAGLASLSRVDLQLLYASVEHRAWLAALEKYLKGERAAPPSLEPQKSRLCLWLDANRLDPLGVQPAFKAIEPVCRQMFAVAAELCRLHARSPTNQKARAKLKEFHSLRDTLSGHFQALMQNQCR